MTGNHGFYHQNYRVPGSRFPSADGKLAARKPTDSTNLYPAIVNFTPQGHLEETCAALCLVTWIFGVPRVAASSSAATPSATPFLMYVTAHGWCSLWYQEAGFHWWTLISRLSKRVEPFAHLPCFAWAVHKYASSFIASLLPPCPASFAKTRGHHHSLLYIP